MNAGAISFSDTLTAVSASVATRVSMVGKPLVATAVVSTVTLVLQIGKLLVTSSASVVTIVRQTVKTLAASASVSVATLATVYFYHYISERIIKVRRVVLPVKEVTNRVLKRLTINRVPVKAPTDRVIKLSSNPEVTNR